jgi:pyruvate kinase
MGPAVSTPEKIRELIHAGMDVARLNFSHGGYEQHRRTIEMLKEARDELEVPLAIMLDTKGPEIRLGKLKDDAFHLPAGHRWLLTTEDIEGDLERVSVVPGDVLVYFEEGMTVLLDNGYISSKVIEKRDDGVLVEIENGGVIKSRKGINVPDTELNLPVVSPKDIEDIKFGCEMDIDIVAASFIRSAEHVVTVKELLRQEKKSDVWVIAKIENRRGVDNLDSILQVADGIMVARGDLGVEVPMTQVPRLQKMMIRKACMTGKPAVTATHMLESMITNPRPTRAETSDVANAIYDSTSAVMLSGETAVGKYPIETVKVMKSIAFEAEEDFPYQQYFQEHSGVIYNDVPSSVTLAAVKTAYSSNGKAIFAFTQSGSTPRLLSRLRPKMPIIAMTPRKKCYHQMAFIWGVVPFYSTDGNTVENAFEALSNFALEKNMVAYGDLVVVTAGQPFGFAGTTNTMMVENIGDVLVRGYGGSGSKVHGNICIVLSPESRNPYHVRGQILVITYCDEHILPYIKNAAGVILQNHVDDHKSEKCLLDYSQEMNKPVVVRADDACRILQEGQLVTLDPEKSLVYKGVVI